MAVMLPPSWPEGLLLKSAIRSPVRNTAIRTRTGAIEIVMTSVDFNAVVYKTVCVFVCIV